MGKRIFIGYNNTVSLGTLLKNGFNSLNIKADFYTSEKNRSFYDYYGNEEYISLVFSKNQFLRYFQVILFLFKIVIKYKYFIFIQKGTLLKNYKDVNFLKFFWKKTLIVFTGCDIRMPERVEKYKWNPCSNCRDDYKTMVNCNIERKKNDLKKVENIFDFVVSPDECAGYLKKKYYSHYFPVDFNYLDKYLINSKEIKTNSITIIHAPSNFHIKGTFFIDKTIDNLKRRYPFIIYKRLHGIPKDEIIRELLNADIVIDQMLVGFYGVLSVEAMALKKPVVCYIRPDLWKDMKSYCPIINANPDNLEEVLEKILKDPSQLTDRGMKSREYALKYHSPTKIAEYILSIMDNN
ncbi:glycosyltransferase [Bacteroidota bacterium]